MLTLRGVGTRAGSSHSHSTDLSPRPLFLFFFLLMNIVVVPTFTPRKLWNPRDEHVHILITCLGVSRADLGFFFMPDCLVTIWNALRTHSSEHQDWFCEIQELKKRKEQTARG